LRFFFELEIGEAQDGVASEAEVEVAGVVVLEGDRAAVVEPEVGLDDNAIVAPEEVGGPTAELDVYLRAREGVAMDEGEEERLEV
jgi:hypothetical protein